MKTEIAMPAAEPAAGQEPARQAPEAAVESSTREELVRQAAYRRYRARGETGSESDAVQDWLDAEAEVNQSFVE